MRVTGPLLVALAGTLALTAVAGPVAAARAPVPNSTSFERGHAAYMDRRFDDARVWFEKAVAESTPNARAWLAYTWFRLNDPEVAWRQAHVALAEDSCDVVAWDALSHALNPQYVEWARENADSAWSCLLAGARCDSLDGDLWKLLWIGALSRGDHALAARAVRGLHEAGIFRPPLLEYCRWVISALPPRAVLLVNGDADSYPMLVLQQVEGLRPDVTMVHLSLLNLPWYRRHVRDRLGVPMPFAPDTLDLLKFHPDGKGGWLPPSREVVQGWLPMRADGSLDRPLAMAATVGRSEVPATARECGPFTLLHPAYRLNNDADTTTARRSIMSLDFARLAGEGVTPADRSPAMRGSGAMVRYQVGIATGLYYYECRWSGEHRAAEALRKWVLARLEAIDPDSPGCALLRVLPKQTDESIRKWEAEQKAASRPKK